MANKKYKNGASYSGAVNSDDQRHGQGVYHYTDGTKYSGQWRNGEKHGNGIYTFADGSQVQQTWNAGIKVSETSVNEIRKSTAPISNKSVNKSTNNNNKTTTSMSKKSGLLGNLGLELGKYTGNDLAYSPAGVAVKRKDGTYIVWDKAAKTLIEIGDLKMDVPFFKVPCLYQQLAVGDLILLDGSFYTVEQKTEANGLRLQSPTTGSYINKPARTNLFGMYFYTKIVTLFESLAPTAGAAGAAAANAANPFGGGFNPMMLMLMNKDNGSGSGIDLTQLMLMSQFSGGGVSSMNPMLLMAAMGEGSNSDDLMQLMLFSQASGTGVNPLAGLFGAPAATAAPAATVIPETKA